MRGPMNLALVDNQPSVNQLQEWLRPFGDYTVTRTPDSRTDFMICWGVSQFPEAARFHSQFRRIPLINYNWDIYEWAIKNPRPQEYNYKDYVKFLLDSVEVWYPANTVRARTEQWMKEWHGVEGFPGHVIYSHSPIYDLPTSDERFVLNAQRANPDERLGWFERACGELGIPYKSTEHKCSQQEFRKILASCTFQVSHYYEMSTGGLSILEGYYLGKPVLLSDSPWQGGGEYMGNRAEYFKHDDFEDLKRKIKDMWESPRSLPADHKEWVKTNFSEERMAQNIHERLQHLYANRKI